MASTPATDTMSSRSSNSPAGDIEEPRKKGSRGGKRSVTHLSKAQLARKRANDREAQRNIRQRTKEHIENLEKKVKELEGGSRSSSMERVLQRNQELEAEIEQLRAQLSSHSTPTSSAHLSADMPDDLLLPQKVSLDWMPESACAWPGALPATSNPMPSSTYGTESPMYATAPPMGYDQHEEASQQMYTQDAIPIWDDPMVFGQQQHAAQSLSKPAPTWTPFHPAFNQPSRVIHSQRHLAINSNDLTGDEIIGPSFPSVHILLNQPGPAKPPSNLSEIMARYAAVLSNRGFALIPEKLASFMCMYRFVQWQISPTYQTYQALHEWQAPRPSQLMIAHPAWMDLPPWGKFRDKVIENQERYDNPEFQNDYAINLSVNFPHGPTKALIFEDGQIMVSKMLERHLSDISNMSMKKPFADKYPEFRDVCRFEEE